MKLTPSDAANKISTGTTATIRKNTQSESMHEPIKKSSCLSPTRTFKEDLITKVADHSTTTNVGGSKNFEMNTRNCDSFDRNKNKSYSEA